MHTPALLKKAIENLSVRADGKYIDATFGEGGYSGEILKRGGKVLAIEWDKDQLKNPPIEGSANFTLVRGNFAEIEKIAKENDFYPVEGVVFDLGLSMGQIAASGRGFSYKKMEEPLDMRIDKAGLTRTAADLLKSTTVEELYNILAKGSEEVKSKQIAEVIKNRKRIYTVGDLTAAIDQAVGFKSQSVYARIFQALRMEINHEPENLKKGLEGAARLLKKGGRLVVVSFHSIEDRIVKNFGKRYGFLNKKPYSDRHGRSFERSAKLRTIII